MGRREQPLRLIHRAIIMATEENRIEDAAILLMTMGEENAAEVFKFLAPKEVQKLGETMARISSVPRDRVEGIVNRFMTERDGNVALVKNTDEYVAQVLRKALGDDKANMLLDRILQGSDVSGIEAMKWMDAGSIAELLRNEHPQIIASILVHLERDHSAAILKNFNERLRNDVVMRVATLDGIQPQALLELNQVLSKVLSGSEKVKKSSMGGPKAAAEMLNFLGNSIETVIVDTMREHDADLAQKVMDQMFTFENLNDLDDRAIQTVLREVQSDALIVALKGADQALRERIFKNMSTRAAETMREDLDAKGPVRLSEVETQQREILKIVRRLADEGQIQMSSGGDDEFV
jgi:flagellar motor switch protein FliG